MQRRKNANFASRYHLYISFTVFVFHPVMTGTKRTFVLVAITIGLLLVLHFLPSITLFGTELRKVNILSDLFGSADAEETVTDTAQAATEVVKEDDNYYVDVPKDVTLIDDYGGASGMGMAPLYKALFLNKTIARPVRIAYFGDSFIEGDIFTSDLRERLQAHFGGEGPGWIDAGSTFNKGFRRSILQSYSGISEFSVVKTPFDGALQGLNQRYFLPSEGATLDTKGTKHYPHASQWERTQFFLRTSGGISVNTTLGEGEAKTTSLEGADRVQTFTIDGKTGHIHHAFRNLKGKNVLYGMALEGKRGIVLDCYSMRGSAGFTIANVPMATLKEFARERPIDLFVIHFGLNVANTRGTKASYDAYMKKIQGVVDHLHEAYPEAGFLIVSVSDRDQRTANGITTMKGVEELIVSQQQMAADGKIAFFNLFKAMGGKGSMAKYVERKLAGKDYTHINFEGGKELSKFLFDAIRIGSENYEKWLGRNSKQP